MSCFFGESIKGRLHVRQSATPESKTLGIPITKFGPKEIRAITKDFSSETLVAESDFYSVYKCSLSGGKVVAVKQLKPDAKQITKSKSQFMSVVNIVSHANHPNLNPLLGYCFTKDRQILVYEFAHKKNLSHHLHGGSRLPWDIRVKIAKGVARALCYLHNECDPQLIHRDIKPQNILLNDAFEAQLSDFGFTKQEDRIRAQFPICFIKTIGYVAPECGLGYKLTDKSDVYSFGIILLEILTRRTPELKIFDRYPRITEWAYVHIRVALANDDFSILVDPELKGAYDKGDVYKMAKAILKMH